MAQAAADLGRAATAPVGLPGGCYCKDPSKWVGWARSRPHFGSVAPFTESSRSMGARQNNTGPHRISFRFQVQNKVMWW